MTQPTPSRSSGKKVCEMRDGVWPINNRAATTMYSHIQNQGNQSFVIPKDFGDQILSAAFPNMLPLCSSCKQRLLSKFVDDVQYFRSQGVLTDAEANAAIAYFVGQYSESTVQDEFAVAMSIHDYGHRPRSPCIHEER